MKIALFSDIHANLPAFEAMLKHMDARQPDAVYCLGDLIGYNVWPNQVIATIRQRGIPTLMGNHDMKVNDIEGDDPSIKKYAYRWVDAMHINYLKTLPSHISLHYNGLNILMVHGSPKQVDEYVLEDTDEHYVLSLMQQANADVLIGGHSHKPFHRVLTTANGHYRHVINIGSVGKPKDGDARGCYVLLTINPHSNTTDKDSLQVEFMRFTYDIEQAAQAILASPLPPELADRLRKAY